MPNDETPPMPNPVTPAPDGHKPDQPKADEARSAEAQAAGGRPRPTRTSVGTDPTLPIKLAPRNKPIAGNPVTPPPAKPNIKPAAGDDDPSWIGSEATLVGVAKDKNKISDHLPIVITDDESSSSWLGQENTLVPESRPQAASGADEPSWIGNEQTLVGAPVPKLPGASGGSANFDEEWVGREATLIGTPAPRARGEGRKGDTTNSRSGKKTNPTLDDGWHLKGRQGPLTGQTIGDYEIGGILGEGGMGTVYRARQISLKRRVAIKVLPPHLTADERMRERFEQEARTASLLNSPHVVQVFATGTHQDTVFFVMEFVEGTDLSAIIHEKQDAKQPFTPDEAANYVIQAARGLAEASRHGIVHRDIKPPNLMVTTKGVVKIADFGISKIAGEHGLTMTGTAVGTPAYVSPEQGRGDQVDQRSDIYSLGIVFYELLAGQKPFDGTTANALIYQHNYAEPKLITELRADTPEAYQAVVIKCMQKDPAKRYQDASELVSDLERVRAGSAPMTALMGAFGTGADEAMRRLGIKQRKLWPILVAAVVILAIGGFVTKWWLEKRGEVSEIRAKLAVLDQARPVPAGAPKDLQRLIVLVGADDTAAVRWSKKLKSIEALTARLGRLDTSEVLDAALRQEATTDLDAYKVLVGADDVKVASWSAKLAAAQEDIVRLRGRLGDLDQPKPLTVASRDSLEPALSQLRTMVGDEDADVERWLAKFKDFAQRLDVLRGRLATVDKNPNLGEVEAASLKNDLAILKQMVGELDGDVQRWTAKLENSSANIARLRQSLRRLDAVEVVGLNLQSAVKPDLTTFKSLVDASDPDLKKWERKLADSNQAIAGLRTRLGKLDGKDPLTVIQLANSKDELGTLRGLAGDNDDDVQRWSMKLRAANDAVAGMRAALAKLDGTEALSLDEQQACASALKELDLRGGLGEDQKRVYTRRLGEEKDRLVALRQRLSAFDQQTTITPALLDDLASAGHALGEQSDDVKRWRAKATLVQGLRGKLEPLNHPAPVPEGAEALLTQLAAQIGEDDEVKRWKSKLDRVAKLKQELAPLEQAAPLAPAAAANVQELVGLVGTDDAQAKRWKVKVDRVAELKTALGTELANAYVLPAASPKQAKELLALISDQDEDAARWSARVTLLTGPGKPAWATEFKRDDYGPYADLTIKSKTQRFRYVPAGEFTIGSPETEVGRDRDESQVHVTLSESFWMADSECAQEFWEAVAGTHDSRFRRPESPVERVSWDDCQAFLVQLNEQVPGLRSRLPTEAQWEYACRAGIEAPFISYQGAVELDKFDTVGWYNRTTSSTKDVKRRFCNPLGLFDMQGNVWEWCQDRYGTYSPTPVTDPLGKEQEERVARGGSWGDGPEKCRAANRLAVRHDMRTLYLGFRIALAVDWGGAAPESPAAPAAAAEIPSAPKADAAPAAAVPAGTPSAVPAPAPVPPEIK